ncbi:MAG: hypothetical protein QNK37_17685 [Acidobacteriota bacterium]|nr:hypothetical protein [Acidobacteriota bacterium]
MNRLPRGITLVEITISMLIGLVVVGSVMNLARTSTRSLDTIRRRVSAVGNLEMAAEALALKTRGLESSFWESFPLDTDIAPVHPMDHTHGAVQFAEKCKDRTSTACLVWWDIIPPDETPRVYVANSWHNDRYLTMSPADPTLPPGPPKKVGNMSVLLFITGANRFCRLVQDLDGETLVLAQSSQQPWRGPADIVPGVTRIVHLGTLEVVHCTLAARKGLGNDLIYRRTYISASKGTWRNARRVSAYTHMQTMAWQPCRENKPDRFVLFAAPTRAENLTIPLTISGKTFDKEVFCASLSF